MPDLPGCMSDGGTRAEALANVEEAIAAWIYSARKMGRAIPEPDCTAPPDGRIRRSKRSGSSSA